MDITVTHKNIGSHNISGVAGLVGYSLDTYAENVIVDCVIEYSANSYDWGEIGQGYFYLKGTVTRMDVNEYNDINVTKTEK